MITFFRTIRKKLIEEHNDRKYAFYTIDKIPPITVILATFLFLVSNEGMFAQSSYDRIQSVREASNAALKALDEEANFEFLTDDVLITTGNGTLLSGKDKLKAYIELAVDDPPMHWVRTSIEIIVNEERGLAWETGIWKAYSADDLNEEFPVFHGNYAAQWTLLTGEWKIQSQLFVTLN